MGGGGRNNIEIGIWGTGEQPFHHNICIDKAMVPMGYIIFGRKVPGKKISHLAAPDH